MTNQNSIAPGREAVTQLPPGSFRLRDYQQRVIKDLYQLLKSGKKCPLIYGPTGSGKTAIGAKIIADAVSKRRRCLILIHRDALLTQTQESLSFYGIEAGIIKGDHPENRSLPVQIASIQTLVKREFPQDIDLVLVDEAHTTCWYKTFDRIKEYYPDAYYIGLTATPWRAKPAQFMGQYFDSLVRAPSVSELIKLGCLTPPRYFGFGELIDLTELDEEDGDYNQRQMQAACMKTGYNERIVKEYLRLVPTRTAIAFCAGIEQSKFLSQLFNASGITSEHLDGSTNSDERQLMYARLKSGKTRVITSINALAEGFNVESISCVILARPTRSRALFFQMAGRGLRISYGKPDCLMLDFGQNFQRLGFLTDPQPIQLEPIERKYKERSMLKECPSCNQLISVFAILCPFCGHEFSNVETIEEDVEDYDSEFGELFCEEDYGKLKYLRQQIRRVYKQGKPNNRVWELFKEKFGYQPPADWHRGAIFGRHNHEANRQRYLDYLYSTRPNPPAFWIRFHMGLEFGFDDTSSEHKGKEDKKRVKTPFTNSPQKPKTWWQILEVFPDSSFADIKMAYRRLALKFHPDISQLSKEEAEEGMKVINLAYEQAKRQAMT